MFAKIRQFITQNPALLGTQLSKLESNVESEFLSVRAELLSAFAIKKMPNAAPFAATLLAGQALLCTLVAAPMIVTLEAPRGEIAGKLALVVRGTPANATLQVAPPRTVRTQGLINGASSYLLPNTVNMIFCDGQDWWA